MKIVFLGGEGELTNAVINKLSEIYLFDKVIIEGKTDRKQFIKSRLRKLGAITVIGQIGFKIFIIPIMNYISKLRIIEIIETYCLDIRTEYKKKENYVYIQNVNSKECIDMLIKISPDIIIVNGTRILSTELIGSTNAKIINMHLGITPKYRGVHGAYWAFYNNDSEHAGVTVHLIDKGIDTGGILSQKSIEVTKKDNFVTYPYIQVGEGLVLEIKAIQEIVNGKVQIINNNLPSQLYSHPTLWQYLSGIIFRGIR